MKRIIVLGVSAGVGKSTFARKLGEQLHFDVCHLDRLYWKPNWVEAPSEEFKTRQREVALTDRWIIEGNYASTLDQRLDRADTIIYLELPLRVCLYRVFKRWITHIGKTRSDMGKDCKEKIDYAFIKYILTTYFPRKKKMAERFEQLKKEQTPIQIVTLKKKKDIQSYIKQFEKQSVHFFSSNE